jgi:hypothetical protein
MQNNIEIFHHQAMELVDRSILAKQQGDDVGSLELLRSPLAQPATVLPECIRALVWQVAKLSAFEQKRFSRGEPSPTAANLVADQLDFEPTRSVLHRSAASLAVECFQLREAEQLIGRALAGNPPPDIVDELRDLLLDAVYSQRQAI